MPTEEKIGDSVAVEIETHPPRTDSPTYLATRRWLMGTVRGGCVICGGVPDMLHPELLTVMDPKGMEDHHGGGIYVAVEGQPILVAQSLFPMEWSLGWNADPVRFNALVEQLNWVLNRVGGIVYPDLPIKDTPGVMKFIDSEWNANVKLCRAHHIGHPTQHTPDANGHEAVGIHNIPGPIWWGQMTNDWARWDMFGGSTGTVVVTPHPHQEGHAVVIHVHPDHPDQSLSVGTVLPPDHPHTVAANAPGAGAAPSVEPRRTRKNR